MDARRLSFPVVNEHKYQVGDAVVISRPERKPEWIGRVGVIAELSLGNRYKVRLHDKPFDQFPEAIFDESELSLSMSRRLNKHDGLLLRLTIPYASARNQPDRPHDRSQR